MLSLLGCQYANIQTDRAASYQVLALNQMGALLRNLLEEVVLLNKLTKLGLRALGKEDSFVSLCRLRIMVLAHLSGIYKICH